MKINVILNMKLVGCLKMRHEEFLKLAVEEANKNSINNFNSGGPFGAVIVKDGKIIARAHNNVLESCDPTAHAEVNAIRLACIKLKTHDLKDCILYASSEPCPMCLSAIIWSNIKEVYFANSKTETDKIGFRDDFIYNYINNKDKDILKLKQINLEEATMLYEDFLNNKEKIMY